MLNTKNTEFSCIEVWFTDQKSKLFEIEVNVNITHTNNWVVVIKMRYPTERKYRKYVKGYAFYHLQEKLEINKVKINGHCNKNRNRYCKGCF